MDEPRVDILCGCLPPSGHWEHRCLPSSVGFVGKTGAHRRFLRSIGSNKAFLDLSIRPSLVDVFTAFLSLEDGETDAAELSRSDTTDSGSSSEGTLSEAHGMFPGHFGTKGIFFIFFGQRILGFLLLFLLLVLGSLAPDPVL